MSSLIDFSIQVGLCRMHAAQLPRPTLGILDSSDGPSGLSRYLEMLWPALTDEFRVVVFGDPRGPYTDFPGSTFVALPEKLWNRRPVGSHSQAGANGPSSSLSRSAMGSLYRRFAPVWARASVGFTRNALAAARILRAHHLDAVYMPLCDLEYAPFAAWIAGVPGRVGVFHLPPGNELSNGIRQLTRMMLKRLTRSIAVAEQVGAAWGALDSAARNRMTVIPNGVGIPDLENRFEQRSSVLAHHDLMNDRGAVWLAAGRLTSQKGFSYLLDAVALLKSRHPEFLVAIAGEGPLQGELSEEISRLGLTRNVKLLGQVRGLDALMRVVDGFVLSSISEAMPYVLLEAMSHALPVVATAVGGVPELVRNGTNGVLCDPGSPGQLATGIDFCLSQTEAARAMAAAARDTIRSYYSAETMRSSTLAVFRSATDVGRTSRRVSRDLRPHGDIVP